MTVLWIWAGVEAPGTAVFRRGPGDVEGAMRDLARRSTVVFGVAAAAAGGAMAVPRRAAARQPHPDRGLEVAPGVRRRLVGERHAMPGRARVLPGYRGVRVYDYFYQPRARTGRDRAPHDMVCLCIEGELRLDHGHGLEFAAGAGDVWTRVAGEPEDVENSGGAVAVLRRIHLLRA